MERRKRIALSLPPEMDEVLERLSALTNQAKTKLILEMLHEYVPVIEQTINALEQMQQNKDDAVAIAKTICSRHALRW